MANGPIDTSTGSRAGNGSTNSDMVPCRRAQATPLFAYASRVPGDKPMVQTSNRFFDEMARLMNDAAGAAQGVRREFETLVRGQAERILSDLDVVRRDEFEAVKEMARLAREENESLKARIAALEAQLGPDVDSPGG